MSDNNSGLPAPAGQPQGISEPQGQPPAQPQTPAPQPPPNPAAPPATPPTSSGPDLAKLQKERDDAVAYARQLQSERDRLRVAVGAPTPPPDPAKQRLDRLVAAGLDPSDAAVFAKAFQVELDPWQQRAERAEAALQSQGLVHQAYNEAAQKNPALFADSTVAQAAFQALNEAALSGNGNYVNPDYATTIAAQHYALTKKPWEQNGQQLPAPQPFRPLGQMSMAGPGGSYAPNVQPSQQQQAEDPAVTAMADKMSMRIHGKPLSQVIQQQP